MIAVTVISLVLSITAIGISLLALKYSKRQTEIMEEQEMRAIREDRDIAEWTTKFDAAVDASLKAARGWLSQGMSHSYAYGLIFPDPALRERIETYLIETDRRRDEFKARLATRERLNLPSVKQTVQEVLDCLAKFRTNDAEAAKKLGL